MSEEEKVQTPAEKFFNLQMQFDREQWDIEKALFSIIGFDYEHDIKLPCEDITFDSYDYSFEFKGCKEGFFLTKEQQQKCWDLGFDCCWLCFGERGQEGYQELYYYKPTLVEKQII